jgi:hypothetical protein
MESIVKLVVTIFNYIIVGILGLVIVLTKRSIKYIAKYWILKEINLEIKNLILDLFTNSS